MTDLKELQKKIKYKFKNQDLLEEALTHSSVRKLKKKNNNERLEFLGDRVLGLIIAKALFLNFPKEKEGDLAKRHTGLVCKSYLVKVAKSIDLLEYIKVSKKGSLKQEKNESVMADGVEALLGAMFLDSDLKKVEKFILKFWNIKDREEPPVDCKTVLQEWAQKKKLGLPKYKTLKRSGSEHNPIFEVTVLLHGFDEITGKGKNKKEAEKQAARAFLLKNQ